MAHRSRNVCVCTQNPDGTGYTNTMTVLHTSVNIDQGVLPITVKAPGINEARFESLGAVYHAFCSPGAYIHLDYGGCDEIAKCLADLGFVRPYGYFN